MLLTVVLGLVALGVVLGPCHAAGLLPPEPAVGTGRGDGRVPGRRPAGAGILLGADADPHGAADRRLGPRQPSPRRGEVRAVHPGVGPAAAGGHRGAGRRPPPRHRRADVLLSGAPGRRGRALRPPCCPCWRFFLAFAVKLPAVPVHTWLPDGPHRGAHRRQRRAGRAAAEDRRLRPAALRRCPCFRPPRAVRAGGHGPGRGRRAVGRAAGLRPARPEAPGGLHQRQPHGLRAAGRVRLRRRGLARRADGDDRPRPEHRRPVRGGGPGAGPHRHPRPARAGRPVARAAAPGRA